MSRNARKTMEVRERGWGRRHIMKRPNDEKT